MSSVPDNNTTLCPASLCSLIFANAISEISGTIFSLKHCSASDFINDTDFPCRYGRLDRIAMPDLSFIFLHIKTTFRSISIIVYVQNSPKGSCISPSSCNIPVNPVHYNDNYYYRKGQYLTIYIAAIDK